MNQLDLRENEWTIFKLAENDREFPKVDLSISFNAEYFKIKAEVHDLHFKDGDRSWRYGDGFLMNFVTQTKPDHTESSRFYAYGFSVIDGKNSTTLVNHNGEYYLSDHTHQPAIQIDRENKLAQYSIELPWKMLKPFHPLLEQTMGINIQYNSQNEDGSTYQMQLVEDDDFDSEVKAEKQYLPVSFTFDEQSSLKFAIRLENHLVQEEEVALNFAAISPVSMENNLSLAIHDQAGQKISQSHKKITLHPGLNRITETLSAPAASGHYFVKFLLEGYPEKETEFYRLNTGDLEQFEVRLEKRKEKLRGPIEMSSYLGMRYKLDELEEQVRKFDPKENPKEIEGLVTTIASWMDQFEVNQNIYSKTGYVRTAFRSETDGTLQPYSLFLPDNFKFFQPHKLIVALHGSGVDEVGFMQVVGKMFADLGYVVASPRGRDLSDWYVGQTETDIRDMMDTLKEMFSIDKTLLFGFSMGGYGVWRLTFKFPTFFDCAVIGSGAINYECIGEIPAEYTLPPRDAARYIPYLVMHGTEDRSVPFKEVKEFVETLKSEGFDITFEVFEGAGHGNYDCWNELANWLKRYKMEN